MSRNLIANAALAAALLALPTTAAAATNTTLQPLADRGQLSVRGELVAVTEGNSGVARLLVGKPGALKVSEAKNMPAWAIPHLGTDAKQRVVVVYPSCSNVKKVASCDLRVVDAQTGKDEALGLSGVNSSKGESEGTLDRGALAFTRWRDGDEPRAISGGGWGRQRTALHYRPAKGPTRLLAADGGQQLALDRGRVLQVRGRPTELGCVTDAHLDLIRVSGKRQEIAKQGCGEDAQTLVSPVFDGSRVLFVMRSYSGAWVRSVKLDGSSPRFATVWGGPKQASIAPTSASSALIVHGDYLDQGTGELDEPERVFGAPWTLRRTSGLKMAPGRQ